jgi:putative redox protein
MNIAARIVELNSKKNSVSRKPINSLFVRSVRAKILERRYQLLFPLDPMLLTLSVVPAVVAGPAVGLLEVAKSQRPCAGFSNQHCKDKGAKIMGTATVRWISGKQFIGIDSTQHSVVLSTPDEGVGIKPSDLLLIAVASCTAVDVVEILSKKRMTLDHLEIICTGEQDQNPPWTFRKIHLRYIVGGKDLTEKAVAQAIQLSEEKYCSVAATVRATAEITTEFEILEEELQLA